VWQIKKAQLAFRSTIIYLLIYLLTNVDKSQYENSATAEIVRDADNVDFKH